MQKVFIICRCKGSTPEKQLKYWACTLRLMQKAIDDGLIPIVPFAMWCWVLDEDKPEERTWGRSAGMEMMRDCDLVWHCRDYGESEGTIADRRWADYRAMTVIEVHDPAPNESENAGEV